MRKKVMKMKNTKVLTLTASVGSLILAGTASADFQGISFTMSSSSYGDTYLIYADVDAGDQLNAVYGDDSYALTISSDGGFYQTPVWGVDTTFALNPNLILAFPSLAYDSWVTIGLEDNVGNHMMNIGIDFTDFNSGGSLWTDNGSWFATPDDDQVMEVNGSVLIGQFTVASGDHVFGTINMQGKDADLNNWNAIGIDFDTLPAPGALALLGLAGLSARRRRK
jgi:MYXO-CTERM domain-containing protein